MNFWVGCLITLGMLAAPAALLASMDWFLGTGRNLVWRLRALRHRGETADLRSRDILSALESAPMPWTEPAAADRKVKPAAPTNRYPDYDSDIEED